MPRVRLGTVLMLLVVAGSNAACVHAPAFERQSLPFFSPQTDIKLGSPSCVNTAAMPIIGLKVDAPKPLPPPREYNMPVIRLSACYLRADSGASIKRIVPTRDTLSTPK